MMPEGIETLLDRRELADLFAFLCWTGRRATRRPGRSPAPGPDPGARPARTPEMWRRPHEGVSKPGPAEDHPMCTVPVPVSGHPRDEPGGEGAGNAECPEIPP